MEDDEPINPLVNALFDEIEELRMQLYDSQLRCALIEAETREEVMIEMEERMQSMEDMFTKRLMREVSLRSWALQDVTLMSVPWYVRRWNTTKRGWTPNST